MFFVFIFTLINCTEDKKANSISLSEKNIDFVEKPSRKKRSPGNNKIVYNIRKRRWKVSTATMPSRDESKCEENSKTNYIYYNLETVNFTKIDYLSYAFYIELLKNAKFIQTCNNLGLLINQDFPSETMFGDFVFKFVRNKDFHYRNTTANKFIQSIAWRAHKHIVYWSRTNLVKYMSRNWSIVWQNIINSINISTDRNCYWRVDRLFDGDRLAHANEQLDNLEKGEILLPTLYQTNNKDYSRNPSSDVAIEYLVNPSMPRLLN